MGIPGQPLGNSLTPVAPVIPLLARPAKLLWFGRREERRPLWTAEEFEDLRQRFAIQLVEFGFIDGLPCGVFHQLSFRFFFFHRRAAVSSEPALRKPRQEGEAGRR
jgi:hypothetical protein